MSLGIDDHRRNPPGTSAVETASTMSIGNDGDDVVRRLISIEECLQIGAAARYENDDARTHDTTLSPQEEPDYRDVEPAAITTMSWPRWSA